MSLKMKVISQLQANAKIHKIWLGIEGQSSAISNSYLQISEQLSFCGDNQRVIESQTRALRQIARDAQT